MEIRKFLEKAALKRKILGLKEKIRPKRKVAGKRNWMETMPKEQIQRKEEEDTGLISLFKGITSIFFKYLI